MVVLIVNCTFTPMIFSCDMIFFTPRETMIELSSINRSMFLTENPLNLIRKQGTESNVKDEVPDPNWY